MSRRTHRTPFSSLPGAKAVSPLQRTDWVGHAAMETFLLLNGLELLATVDEQETIVLGLAAGSVKRAAFTEWVRSHIRRAT